MGKDPCEGFPNPDWYYGSFKYWCVAKEASAAQSKQNYIWAIILWRRIGLYENAEYCEKRAIEEMMNEPL